MPHSANHWSATQGLPPRVKLKGSLRITSPEASILFAGGDVPERARVAEHVAAADQQQSQPDDQEQAGGGMKDEG